jgi:hypothetical protein
MKRDMDLVREILLVCEADEHGRVSGELQIDGYTDEQIGYHAYLMIEAGLARGFDQSGAGDPSPQGRIISLTWAGYDFLEASRDDGRWNKVKQAAKSVGGMAIDVLKPVLIDLATQAMKKAVGLP